MNKRIGPMLMAIGFIVLILSLTLSGGALAKGPPPPDVKPSCECDKDSDCDDGKYCTIDKCIRNECKYSPRDCKDGDVCTDDSCDEVNNECDHVFDPTNDLTCEPCYNVVCDDGNWCNGLETCNPQTGACVPGTPPDCTDTDICTNDSCNETTDQCVNSTIPNCCITDPQCNDGNACTTNECIDNRCVYTPECTENADCNDDNACTADSCDASGCCVHEFICECKGNAECDDQNACTTDACVNNACVNTPITCNDGVGCTDDSCNPASGCVYTPDDSYCNNGLFCDGEEYCDPDKDCQDGTPVNCDDEEVCTDDRCSEDKDKCVHEFDSDNARACRLSAIASTDCTDWSCTLTSKEAKGDYSVKVILDGDVVFEKSGTLLGTKKFEQGLALAGTGDHDIKVTCSIKVGDDVVKDISEKTLHCGKGGPTPTPTPPPPPTPTPTPVSEVKGVEVLPTTGEVATLGLSTPMMLRALGVVLMTSGGLLGWLNRGNSGPGSGSGGPAGGDPPSGHRPPSRQRSTQRRNGSGPRRSDPWQP